MMLIVPKASCRIKWVHVSTSWSITEGSWGRNLRPQVHSEAMKEGLLLTACSACFLIESRTISSISSSMALCTVGSHPAPIAALIKSPAPCRQPFLRERFSQLSFPFLR